jgi:hypothetical protein
MHFRILLWCNFSVFASEVILNPGGVIFFEFIVVFSSGFRESIFVHFCLCFGIKGFVTSQFIFPMSNLFD